MPFGLCNAPATFQRCMVAIFHDMIEDSMEIFMDDFSIFGNSFEHCLCNLEKMLARCENANLVLNWEKCHFMVTEGIVLGHKISQAGLEVDRSKIDTISKLPPPTSVKSIRSFLGHVGFYRRFIKYFSKIARPMTQLLEKDTVFIFSDECYKAFELLKEKLVNAPIMAAPDWTLPFELMCDASDFVVGAVLGQRKEKHFHPSTMQNVAADYLSRLECPASVENMNVDINDNFPHEFLISIDTVVDEHHWFADFENYLVSGVILKRIIISAKEEIPCGCQSLLLERPIPVKDRSRSTRLKVYVWRRIATNPKALP
ncbi:hypothetical protein L1987_48220 [Smallanthus sonchifolius]|uniref:Uncharacterized protein n=1 Tax=Smallanthus sonchifolius TaxID=185202 RepID=A0ACB9FS95_9ASTR|nr:hypothetical protein L1987_48220 [Smallanthus sonchifolius]